MCIFSGEVDRVSETQIFARFSNERTGAGTRYQVLIYEMRLAASSELAMILPLPAETRSQRSSSAADVLRFVDLSAYSEFFEDMNAGFVEEICRTQPVAASAPPLVVESVGSFEASFVPTLTDFSRLDSRFTLDPEIWRQLPEYSDYSFAVFKLKPGESRVHPMAFVFLSRYEDRLFFPTVHVHEGEAVREARFDHSLFCQSSGSALLWPASNFPAPRAPASKFMDCARAEHLVEPDLPVYRHRMHGVFENQDIIVGLEKDVAISWADL